MIINKTFIKELVIKKYNIIPTYIDKIKNFGTMNLIYFVNSYNQSFIIRLRKDIYASNEYLKEKWCLNKALESGIFSPKVLDIGSFGSVDYIIEEYIEGTNGNNYFDKLYIYRKLGEYAKKLHSINVSGFGIKLVDYNHGIFESDCYHNFEDQIDYNINKTTQMDELIPMKIYEKEDIESIKMAFTKLKNFNIPIGLNHGDLSLNNTIVDKYGKVFLIDYGSANVNIIPYSDLVNLKFNTDAEFNSFIEGYGMSKDFFEQHKDIYFAFKLLVSFDKLRWALDIKTNQYIDWYCSNAQKVYKEFKKHCI